MVKSFNKTSFSRLDSIEKCREVLELVRKKGPTLTVRQLNYCDEACIRRFLKSKGGDLKKAARQLRGTLSWRVQLDLDNLTADEFPTELTAGNGFVAGQDDDGRQIVIVRFKPEHTIASQEQKQFFRYIIFTMEVAISCMSASIDQCILILDVGGLRKGTAALSTVVQLLRLLADHYPERVAKTYVVDPTSMFYYLWKGIGGLFGIAMKDRLQFVYSRRYEVKSGSLRHLPHSHSLYNNQNELEAGDQFDFSNTISCSSKAVSSAGQTVLDSSSFRFPSSSSASLASSVLTSSSSSAGSSLALENGQTRSFSFATGSGPTSGPLAASVEFRSFRADGKYMDVDDEYASGPWAELSFSSSLTSTTYGSKAEEISQCHLESHTSKEKGMDPFFFYYNQFFIRPYSESDYRAKMRAPLGGLAAMVSTNFNATHADLLPHHKFIESLFQHLTFGS